MSAGWVRIEVVDDIVTEAFSEYELVVASTARHSVVSGTAIDCVVVGTTTDVVVSGTAPQRIVASAAGHAVVASVTVNSVVTCSAIQLVVTAHALDGIFASATIQTFGTVCANERIVIVDHVLRPDCANDCIVAAARIQDNAMFGRQLRDINGVVA